MRKNTPGRAALIFYESTYLLSRINALLSTCPEFKQMVNGTIRKEQLSERTAKIARIGYKATKRLERTRKQAFAFVKDGS